MKKGVLLGLLGVAVVLMGVLLLLPVGYFDSDSVPPPVQTSPLTPPGAVAEPAPVAPADPNAALAAPAAAAAPGSAAPIAPIAPANPELVERAIEQAERELHTPPGDSSNAAIPCDNDLSATSDCPPGAEGLKQP